MNQADKDFEAAVIELRQGYRTNLIKFGAWMMLLFIVFGFVLYFTYLVSTYVR